jgi:DNA-binding transcriptional regulator PaaX
VKKPHLSKEAREARREFMSIAGSNPTIYLILRALDLNVPLIPLETPYEWIKRKREIKRRQYRDSLRGLEDRGIIRIVEENNQKFIKLTKKGALKVLLAKAQVKIEKEWDGKWRVLVFDIPENFHFVRDHFRNLLKQNHFIKLQASVFISPYSLNRDAIRYLQNIGLMKFVRIMKVEEMDNDADLKKIFNLS